MERYRHRAGLDLPPGQRGFHSLRHTLATQLVRQGRPLKLVAEVLGHTSLRSTFLYTKSDFEALRAVALSWRERVRPDLAKAAMATRYRYDEHGLAALRGMPASPQEVRA
jgi:integrase